MVLSFFHLPRITLITLTCETIAYFTVKHLTTVVTYPDAGNPVPYSITIRRMFTHSITPRFAMDILTDIFTVIIKRLVPIGSHRSLTLRAFRPLFLLCVVDYLVKHSILEDTVHRLALIGYLTINPRLHIDVNRPSPY